MSDSEFDPKTQKRPDLSRLQTGDSESAHILDYVGDMSLELAHLCERAGFKSLSEDFYKTRAKIQRTPRDGPPS